jgi:hypothetical protein
MAGRISKAVAPFGPGVPARRRSSRAVKVLREDETAFGETKEEGTWILP